jgi:probable phosphoglycerate mutase
VERINWTVASGLSLDEFLVEWQKSTEDRDYVPRVGESSNAVAERMLSWLRELPDRYAHLVIGVGHGGATVDMLRTVIGDVEVEHRAPALIEQGVPCGALTELAVDEDGCVSVGSIATVDHLQSERPHRVV